jgi:glutamine synthetase
MLCSFAPIVREGHAGNGLHFHLSPVSNGRHVAIRNGEGALAAEAKWLIAGLVRLGASLMAFGNRGQGSFVRLSQGKEAPKAIFWGDYDRRALIRLPIVPKAADGRGVSPSTVEFRLPDGSAHPYLLLAGVAQAMLHGRATERIDDLIESASPAGAEANGSAGPVSPVPRNPRQIAEALIAGRAALESGGVFPPVLIDEVLARLGG